MKIAQTERLRTGVRRAYSKAAEQPGGEHPFPVGAQFAESLGYPKTILSSLPSASADAFTGVSNVSIFADIPEGSCVLDLGCGAGLDSLIAARKAGDEGKVIGVDFCESMLSRSRTSAKKAGTRNINFIQADGERLPIPRETIDIALVNGIFNLNPKREAIFHELARVLRRGGTVYSAELILKEPLPEPKEASEADWFA